MSRDAAACAETRADALRGFLRATGWGGARLAPLAGDASARRYLRLTGGPGDAGAVLMDADPAAGEDVRPFAALTGWLRAQGFSAPDILAADAEAGFLLLEDFGDALVSRVCAADPAAEAPLYEAAVDLLAALAAIPPPETAIGHGCAHAVPPYDAATLLREARLATDWWAAGAEVGLSPDALAEFDAKLTAACAAAAEARSTLALRDYHADNLIWLPDRRGLARVGLLDHQDALRGAPAYDLISLLEDARRDVSPDLRMAMAARFAGALKARDPGFDAEAFAAQAAALAAQRNLKIVGIFARLALRDGKPGYLALIPRVWAHLSRDLTHPDLQALAAFVARHLPEPTPQRLARVAAAAGRGAPTA
ncbi:MAG: aminoglycoside phosphotransferase family protein [Rubrimonas sp.]|uniref:aminoglycoside phosphotransferase family protein n=1 Tax=Rubrimonas sp. TaxID=2036015 RepID=UPI002FDE5443